MRLLFDTHIFLWYPAASRKLPKPVLDRIEIADAVFISAASIWEAAIKIKQGRLQANTDEQMPPAIHRTTDYHNAWRVGRHLPEHHRDPFDRMLVAQAMPEPLKLLTADELLHQYSELVEVI